jgi:hypothetical protein
MSVQHRIDRTNGEFIRWEVRRLLLLGLRARDYLDYEPETSLHGETTLLFFCRYEFVKRLLLLGLRARDITSRRDGLYDFFSRYPI